MFRNTKAFSSFSVSDIQKAKEFYSNVLGLEVTDEPEGTLGLHLAGGAVVMIYPKGEMHTPASFTILNFSVANIDEAATKLRAAGVTFERYEGMGDDDNGIYRGNGPQIAWFKDPSDNVIAVMQTE